MSIKRVTSSAKCKSQREWSAGSFKGLRGRFTDAIFCGGLAAPFILFPSPLPAQDALRTSLAGDAAAEAHRVQLENLPYTFKTGDFRLLLTPSVGLDWNDNINLAKTNAEQDFILTPGVQVVASYPVSQQNLLRLNVGVGYARYLDHTELSSVQLKSDSDVAFDVYIKDFWFDFHDQFGYIKDAATQPELAGTGTADLATFNNDAGLTVNWDLEDLTLTTGYDHQNVISSTQAFNSEDHSTDSALGRAGFKLNPKLTVGLESTAAYTTYDQMILNNNAVYSIGAYGVWKPGKYFEVQPRAGYTITQFQQSSSSIQTANENSWYADLNIKHQATDHFDYGLDAGHEVRLGIQSDLVEDWYCRPSAHFDIIKDLGLGVSFSYERGNQGAGNITGNLTEVYNSYSSALTASYMLTKKISLSLSYRLTLRSSSDPTRDYTQNDVGLQMSYHP